MNTPTTPSSHWHQDGLPDPHDDRYNCERAQLAMGSLTDDELANGAFMNYDARPSLQEVISGNAYQPIMWMTAVKDRIRWLSRRLNSAESEIKRLRDAASKDSKDSS